MNRTIPSLMCEGLRTDPRFVAKPRRDSKPYSNRPEVEDAIYSTLETAYESVGLAFTEGELEILKLVPKKSHRAVKRIFEEMFSNITA